MYMLVHLYFWKIWWCRS